MECDWRALLLASSVTSKGRLYPSRYWSARCERSASTKLLFGVMSEPSTSSRGVASWIASLRASRANHSRPRAAEGASRSTCGPTCSESSTGSAQRGDFSKTCRGNPSQGRRMTCAESGTGLSSIGSTAAIPGRGTDARVGGWLPTLTATQNYAAPSMLKWPAYRRLARVANGRDCGPTFWEWMFGIPIGWTDCGRSETESSP